MHRLRTVLLATAAIVIGCAALKDLNVLSSALAQRYHTQATVTLSNGSHLRITFQNVPAGAFDPESVARFAKANYPRADSLDDITIAYVQVTSTGPLTVTHTDAPTTFLVRDLQSAPRAARANER